MKKYLAVLVTLLCLSAQAHAAYVPHPVVIAPNEAIASPAFWPFATAVGLGAFVIYANATGIPFPACGVWNCYYEYPSGKNGG